ncbi:MAG: alpha/beta fold hydrolase [Nocardioidaceae bacterium]
MAFDRHVGGVRRLIDGDGLSLSVVDMGEHATPDGAESPRIVFVHGFPDTHAVWLPVMARLSGRFRCVAYDVRGAGQSGVPPSREGYRMVHLVNDLAAVLDAVSPERPVHLVGHDWGSVQSWEAVLSAESDPRLHGRIASYTTISGPSIGYLGAWMRTARHGSADRRRKVAVQAMHSWYVLAFQVPLLPELALRRLLRTPSAARRFLGSGHAARTVARDAVHGVGLYRANLGGVAGDQARLHTDLPVQLVVPLQDAFLTPAVYDDLPRYCSRLTRRDVDAGHWVQRSHPDEVAALVADFVTASDSPNTP